jgi:uncharacterized membrane protein YbhN (UPF0104 family)
VLSLLSHRWVPAVILAAVVVAVALHVGMPSLAGMRNSLDVLDSARPGWIAVAAVGSVTYLGCLISLFRLVARATPGPHVAHLTPLASYRVGMAAQGASTIITAAGAGGVALSIWALRQAGMSTRRAGAVMTAQTALLYGVYLMALVVIGPLLAVGLTSGPAPESLTLVPAAAGALALGLIAVVARAPAAWEKRLDRLARSDGRFARVGRLLLTVPATLSEGLHLAWEILGDRSRGPRAIALAIGAWAGNIAVLWACFAAFGEPIGPLVAAQAFFVGMAANLLPLLPGGVGSVDAALVGTLLAFGKPAAATVVVVLAYRLIAYWLPTIPEVLAYLTLRRSISRWQAEGDSAIPEKAERVSAAAT